MGANKGLAANGSVTSVGPKWLVARLGSGGASLVEALAVGAKLTPEQHQLAGRALSELILHGGGEGEAVLLEQLARHFLTRTELDSGVDAALGASKIWTSTSAFERANLVLDHALDMVGPASESRQQQRFQLLMGKTATLVAEHRVAQVAQLLHRELGEPHARYSLKNQVLLLVQQASAAHTNGDGVAARQLLAEAMSLTTDVDLQRQIKTTALGIAMHSANGVEMKELSAAVADLSDPAGSVLEPNYDLQFAEILALVIDGEYEQADSEAETLYMRARRAHEHDVAVRAVYARVVVEHTKVGPSDRAVALAEQAVWLAQERGSQAVPLLPIVGLSSLYLDRAEPTLAAATFSGVGHGSLSSVDQLDLAHLETRLALALQRRDGLIERLLEHAEVAVGLQASQYTGVHHLLLAEAWRVLGEIDAAVEESRRALAWLGDCPNQTWVREAVAESIRVQLVADQRESPHRLIAKIDAENAAGAAYRDLCEGLVDSDPQKLRSAATVLNGLKYHYEAMRAQLHAAELDGVPDLRLRDDAATAGIHWIVEAVDRLHGDRTELPLSNRGLPISARQVDVLKLMARGSSNKEIAAELFISDRTASTHVSAILRRLKCRNRAEAVAVWTAAQSGAESPDR